MENVKEIIEKAWEDSSLRANSETKAAIEYVVEQVDKGLLRTAQPNEDGSWTVNDWVKKAIVMYFPIRQMEVQEVGIFEYHDKMKLKSNYASLGVRVVPPAVARYGAFIAKGVILMPSYLSYAIIILNLNSLPIKNVSIKS